MRLVVVHRGFLATTTRKLRTKKGKREDFLLFFMGRFLKMSKPTIAIAMMIATTPTPRYISKSLTVAKPVCATVVCAGVVDSLE